MTKEILCHTQDYLDIAGVIIVVLKPNHCVELINKKGSDVLGYEKDEIVGNNWVDLFIPDEERTSVRQEFNKMFAGEADPLEYYENSIITKNNELRIIRWHNAYLRNEYGEITSILSSGEDITFKKVLQRRLSDLESEKRKQILAAILEAQENERHEIAYELHDNVNQILTTCKILLESEIRSTSASAYVTNSYRYLQNAIDEIRNLSHRLNPAQLEEIGLEASIQELLQHIQLSSSYKVAFTVNNSAALKRINYHIALSLFRIVQEQVSNILKHAEATAITVRIVITHHFIDMEIMDDGKGFHPKTTLKGLGLKNIRNRAEFHQGQFYISSAPGEGCTLSICIPLVSKC